MDKSLNDEYLLSMLACNNKDAWRILKSKYDGFKYALLYTKYPFILTMGIDKEEVGAIIDATFYESVITFNFQETYFYYYWRLNVERMLQSLIKHLKSGKNERITKAIRLDATLTNKDNSLDYNEIIDNPNDNTVRFLNARFKIDAIMSNENSPLNNEEKVVLAFKMLGYRPKEISKRINKTEAQIRSILSSAIKKIEVYSKD